MERLSSGVGCTNGVSDDENWGLELLELAGVGRGKLFDRTDGPPIRNVTKTGIRTHP